MKTINSRQNPEIKAIYALRRPQGRREQKRFAVEGFRACSAMLEAGWEPVGLYIMQENIEKSQKVASEASITLVSGPVMEKISQTKTPSGIVGIFPLPDAPEAEKLESGVVLANISDPGNMGTLIRTCAAMGFKSMVVIEGADPWGHKVVQSTAGAIAQVDIFEWSWKQLLENKKDKKLCALVARDGKKPEAIEKNCLLIVGNEAHGIAPEWIEQCDQKITLPMSDKTESLNAAVAGSIALYLMASK